MPPGTGPCFFCRRKEAQYFLSLAAPPLMADAADRILHEQRFASRTAVVTQLCDVAALPDGAMVAIDGAPFAVRGDRLLRWSFEGYGDALPRHAKKRATLITPPLFVTILANGFLPRWHDSAR